jgi:hypothetical protein
MTISLPDDPRQIPHDPDAPPFSAKHHCSRSRRPQSATDGAIVLDGTGNRPSAWSSPEKIQRPCWTPPWLRPITRSTLVRAHRPGPARQPTFHNCRRDFVHLRAS